MAKVTIAGNSYVVTSEVSMEDLQTVKKSRPLELALVNEETKEPYFDIVNITLHFLLEKF
jgi:hypothetical protein